MGDDRSEIERRREQESLEDHFAAIAEEEEWRRLADLEQAEADAWYYNEEQ